MAAAAPDLPVFRLAYRSHNLVPAPDRKAELGAIFSVSRSGNRERGVTGALLTHGDWFVQTLEGDEGVVREVERGRDGGVGPQAHPGQAPGPGPGAGR